MEQKLYVQEAPSEEQTRVITVTGRSSTTGTARRSIVATQRLEQTVETHTSFYPLIAPVPGTSDGIESIIRAWDILGSLGLLLICLPALIIVALLIKLTSSGSVIYKQRRVGRGGKEFTLYKFRTMIDNAEEDTGPIWAAKDDPRVTSIGRILRKTRLDELPQLFNVLRGDMSLVGPRPERPYFVRRHRALQGIRLTVKPGLTGLAQIRKLYDLKPTHKLKYDYLYIRKRSLLLNSYILLKTLPVILSKSGW
jgi:lipopolysaccharide/colanic/teichoic acid biosynthesis glycosyltransferase